MKKIIIAALGAASIVGSVAGMGTASATPMPEVCQAIDDAPTYRSYLIDAAVWGVAFNWDTSTQAQNIVDSVKVYCPWHMNGMLVAAESLTR